MISRTEGRGQWPQGQRDEVHDLKDRGTRSMTSRTGGRGQWPQGQGDEVHDLKDRDEVNNLKDSGTWSMTSRKRDEVNDRSRCSPADRSRSGTCSSRTGNAPPPSLRSSTSSLQVHVHMWQSYRVNYTTLQDINNRDPRMLPPCSFGSKRKLSVAFTCCTSARLKFQFAIREAFSF